MTDTTLLDRREFDAMDKLYLGTAATGFILFLFFLVACIQGSETTWFGIGALPAFFLFWSLLMAIAVMANRWPDSFIDFLQYSLGAVSAVAFFIILPFYGIPGIGLRYEQSAEEYQVLNEANCRHIDELVANGNGEISNVGNGIISLKLDNDDRFLFETSRLDNGREQCKVIKEFRKYDEFN